MRETRPSGSEGGEAETNRLSLPLFSGRSPSKQVCVMFSLNDNVGKNSFGAQDVSLTLPKLRLTPGP